MDYQHGQVIDAPADDADAMKDIPNGPSTALVPHSAIETIVAQRDAAMDRMNDAAEMLERAYALSEAAVTHRIAATQGESFYFERRHDEEDYKRLFNDRFDKAKSLDQWRKVLDASVWTHLFKRTGLENMLDATAKEEWRKSLLTEVPEVTYENIRATLETVAHDSDMIFKRGLAKAFAKLDRRFRSHDGFKIGSRVILNYLFNDSGRVNYGYKKDVLMDIERVFAVLDGQAPNPGLIFKKLDSDRVGWNPQQSETDTEFFKIRGFKNGNAHLWMQRDDLVVKVNKLLAEYYGEVIPDGVPKSGMQPEDLKSKAGLPSKDLAYYFTPDASADAALENFWIEPGAKVLEPSAGTGHLVRAILRKQANCEITAIEFDAGRAASCKATVPGGVKVACANFLKVKAVPVFDHVVMNPPFYGTHWMEHIMHAWDFLKPDGTLLAILPVSAEVGDTQKHEAFRAFVEKNKERWGGNSFNDMPDEAFAEAGTRIHTVKLKMRKPK